MQPNLLVTGAAGFVGGSLIADFISRNTIQKEFITAAVRSLDQEKALSGLGVNVVHLNLKDELDVAETIRRNRINLVIHTVSSIDPSLALPLITALSKQKERGEPETFFIHVSGLSGFYRLRGWPSDVTDDTGPVFSTEKKIADSYPSRKTDVAVIEHAKRCNVTCYVVVPPPVYGRGTGPWNKLSTQMPLLISGLIRIRQVHKFPENTKCAVAHISDLTALFGIIVDKIRQGEDIPHGEEGYYLTVGHYWHWHEVLSCLASALKSRNLVDTAEVGTWQSDQEAADMLRVPVQFVQQLWNPILDIVASRPQSIGWRPEWDEKRFLDNIGDEVDAVLEEGTAKSDSILQYLYQAASSQDKV